MNYVPPTMSVYADHLALQRVATTETQRPLNHDISYSFSSCNSSNCKCDYACASEKTR